MNISRIIGAGVITVALVLGGCAADGPDDAHDASSTEPASPPEEVLPDETPTPDTTSEGAEAGGEEGADSPDLDLPDADVDVSIDVDAHPFCAVMGKLDQDSDYDSLSDEQVVALVEDLRDEAITAAPEDIRGDVTTVFDYLVDQAKEQGSPGVQTEADPEDLSDELREALSAMTGFTFETCFDFDLAVDEG